MSKTFVQLYIHIIFSTQKRVPLIDPKFEQRLWAYMGGIARSNKMKALAVDGIPDHVHILTSIPPTLSVSKALQLFKGGSSKWLNDHFFEDRSFRWQSGYGAFSVSHSMVPATINYIQNQKEHHRHKTFKEEYLEFLDKHNIPYDPKHVFE